MLSWLPALLGLVPQAFNTIQGITSAIANERLALISAKTDQEKQASEERIRNLEFQRDLMVVESSKSNLNIYLRSLLALGPATILLKIFVWDKTVGPFVGCVGKNTPAGCEYWTTDALDPNLWYVVMVAIGFYFLTSMRK